jgi:hypothetical protein
MTTQTSFLLAATAGFLTIAPALANDPADAGVRERPALAGLQGVHSTGALFLTGAGDPASTAVPGGRATTLTVPPSGQLNAGAPAEPQVPAAPPIAAMALPPDVARPGGTNLYGMTRDPRATITTPAGLRLADPKLLQTLKIDTGSAKLLRSQ